MRRIIKVLVVGALIAVMTAVSATPAMAEVEIKNGNGKFDFDGGTSFFSSSNSGFGTSFISFGNFGGGGFDFGGFGNHGKGRGK